MRWVLLLAALCGPLLGRAAADGVAAPEKAAIQRVIADQIEAFRNEDGTAALRFASPDLQARFGTGAQFLAMVRHTYAPVVGPRSVEFGDTLPHAGHVLQKVELVGADGHPALAYYDMEREDDGSWRIAGCILVESERTET